MAVALLASACGGGDDTSREPTDGASGGAEADPAEAADRGAEFTFAYSTGVNSFDPHTTPGFSGDQLYMRPVYDRLFTIGAGDDGRATLAPSWRPATSTPRTG